MEEEQQLLKETIEELQDDAKRDFKSLAKNKILHITSVQKKIAELQRILEKAKKELSELTLEPVDASVLIIT